MNTLQPKFHQSSFQPKSRHVASRGITKPIRLILRKLQLVFKNPHKPTSIFFLLLCFVLLVILVELSHRTFIYLFSSNEQDISLDLQNTNGSTVTWNKQYRKYDASWIMSQNTHNSGEPYDFVEIAYFIQAAGNSIVLLPRLFSRIHHQRHVYIVHMDAKVPASNRSYIVQLVQSNPEYAKNIHFLESEMITYKAITMVTNTLAGMTLALEKHKSWKYFINLSGVDYPLVSPENQGRLLARPKAQFGRLNFLTFFPRKEWAQYQFRIRNMHWDPAEAGKQNPNARLYLLRAYKTNPMEQFRAFTFTKAEAWMILSRPFVQFVVRSAYAKRMLLNHLHVLSVPEHYFADILYNHPIWRKTIVPDAFRKVLWYLNNNRSGQHPHVLDQGPTILSRWSYIEETTSLFARKISIHDSPLLDKIDTEMNGYATDNNENQPSLSKDARQVFYKRIVNHFDTLTQETLKQQGVQWSELAYPEL